jgi:hypothetical protein
VAVSLGGNPYPVQAHKGHFHHSMPFTVERWRKCQAIRDGIQHLSKLLLELLGNGGADAAIKLDGAVTRPLFQLGEHSDV